MNYSEVMQISIHSLKIIYETSGIVNMKSLTFVQNFEMLTIFIFVKVKIERSS